MLWEANLRKDHLWGECRGLGRGGGAARDKREA